MKRGRERVCVGTMMSDGASKEECRQKVCVNADREEDEQEEEGKRVDNRDGKDESRTQ